MLGGCQAGKDFVFAQQASNNLSCTLCFSNWMWNRYVQVLEQDYVLRMNCKGMSPEEPVVDLINNWWFSFLIFEIH